MFPLGGGLVIAPKKRRPWERIGGCQGGRAQGEPVDSGNRILGSSGESTDAMGDGLVADPSVQAETSV